MASSALDTSIALYPAASTKSAACNPTEKFILDDKNVWL
jgi:hypothetical protein